MEAAPILRRYEIMLNERATFDNLWQEVVDYIVPWRAHITSTVLTQGQKKTIEIFDSTAPQSLVVATSALHSATTPNTLRWFSLVARDPVVNDDRDSQIWLTDARDVSLAAINQSNFDAEIQEAYSDLIAFGTSALDIRENDSDASGDFTGLIFRAHQPGTFTIAEGKDGIPDTVFRELRMTVGTAAKHWGVKNLSERAQKTLEKSPDEFIGILWATFPRDDVAKKSLTSDQLPRDRPFAEVIIELPIDGQPSGGHVITVTGAHELPTLAPRWRKMSGEVYGRGPGLDILPDVRTLNKAIQLRLEAWVLAVAPPVLTRHRGVVGEVRLKPFGRTYVRERGDVEPFIVGSNFDVSNFQEEQIRRSIRSGFFVDQIQFTGSKGDTPISATEATFRFQNMQRILGPAVSRIQTELLAPLVSRVLHILFRRGVLPPPPPALAATGLDIVFEGPLARVQRSTDIESINQFMSLLFPIAEVNREILALIDFTEVINVLAEATAVPKRILRDKKEAERIMEQQRKAAMQQQLQQNVLQAAEVLNKVPSQA